MARLRGKDEGNQEVGVTRASPAGLSVEDVRLVAEAIDQLATWLDDFEEGRRRVGETILRNVFDEDPRAMLSADRAAHPKFHALLERARSELRFSDAALSLVCRVTALDHLVRGRWWSRLGTPQKEALLPLATDDALAKPATLRRLNEAAKHVLDFDLDRDATQRYVREQLRQEGKEPALRATSRTYERQLERSLDLFATPEAMKRLDDVAADLDDETRARLEKKLRSTAEALLAAVKRLKKR